jgi:glucan 1,3-beta-glucosidase
MQLPSQRTITLLCLVNGVVPLLIVQNIVISTDLVNGYKAGNRYEGTLAGQGTTIHGSCDEITLPITQWSGERKNTTRKFIEAQLESFDLSGGWIWWTAKTELVPGADNAWDMGQLVDNGVFPQPFGDRIYGGCSS